MCAPTVTWMGQRQRLLPATRETRTSGRRNSGVGQSLPPAGYRNAVPGPYWIRRSHRRKLVVRVQNGEPRGDVLHEELPGAAAQAAGAGARVRAHVEEQDSESSHVIVEGLGLLVDVIGVSDEEQAGVNQPIKVDVLQFHVWGQLTAQVLGCRNVASLRLGDEGL